MTKRYYHQKVPAKKFTPDPCHWTRTDEGHWKVKRSYDSEDDAEKWLKQNPRLIEQGMKSYQCPVCGKWHCGHKQD